ncbi:hypothetical protein BU25DRAFT_368941 [Macroventuria anomochaeta]|uniref:Uncharacterized protein n=1 Tax=Macroventuria anomochaeta TaxID=301207 RepID=A0ACB6RZ69_9PLEO|nr:uncharacterized protein BU25DRAFT_368941 [Macroventuria anomochaeta]KAF2627181.1 hypothetical protein BU25DRAFT_368941 [Macroventuria anomochaeta]
MSAPGELSLSKLLASLKPVLSPETFVFATFAHNTAIPTTLPVQMLFRESEGTTLITTKAAADAEKIQYTFASRMITLDVHSSLEAVGFVAVVTNKLKELSIGLNPVSGYFHDHFFVPEGREEEAVECLKAIAREAQKEPI